MNSPPLSRLGKYEVLREIARGSMGIVYLGHDMYIDRPVAIKVAHSDQLDDEESGERYRKMFFNEAHTAGRLTHPNVISIYDAGVEGEICYIVMEYVDGIDLGKLLAGHDNELNLPELPLGFKCHIARQIVEVMDFHSTSFASDRCL